MHAHRTCCRLHVHLRLGSSCTTFTHCHTSLYRRYTPALHYTYAHLHDTRLRTVCRSVTSLGLIYGSCHDYPKFTYTTVPFSYRCSAHATHTTLHLPHSHVYPLLPSSVHLYLPPRYTVYTCCLPTAHCVCTTFLRFPAHLFVAAFLHCLLRYVLHSPVYPRRHTYVLLRSGYVPHSDSTRLLDVPTSLRLVSGSLPLFVRSR